MIMIYPQVIGIGREYTDYTQKIVWYLEALEGVNTTLRMIDDDIVVLIDAYDVILFPAARRISQTLQTFSTPVVFCSENGIYPEFAAPWYYARGSMYWNSFNEHNQVYNGISFTDMLTSCFQRLFADMLTCCFLDRETSVTSTAAASPDRGELFGRCCTQ